MSAGLIHERFVRPTGGTFGVKREQPSVATDAVYDNWATIIAAFTDANDFKLVFSHRAGVREEVCAFSLF